MYTSISIRNTLYAIWIQVRASSVQAPTSNLQLEHVATVQYTYFYYLVSICAWGYIYFLLTVYRTNSQLKIAYRII